jgi:hypothetical protein
VTGTYSARGIGSRSVPPAYMTLRAISSVARPQSPLRPPPPSMIVARGLPSTCDARVYRPSTRDHMSTSYCGPDCASRSVRSTDERNSPGTMARWHARAQEGWKWLGGGSSKYQASAGTGTVISKSRRQYIPLGMGAWDIARVEIGEGGGRFRSCYALSAGCRRYGRSASGRRLLMAIKYVGCFGC